MAWEDIAWFIVTAVLSFVIGVLMNQLKNKINKEIKEDTAIKNGLRCLLREQIIQICDRCNTRGDLRMHDLESLDDLYHEYRALEGNGSIEKLVEDTKKLKVV